MIEIMDNVYIVKGDGLRIPTPEPREGFTVHVKPSQDFKGWWIITYVEAPQDAQTA